MSNPTHIILSLGAAALLLTLPSVARADLAACGGVYLSVDAACEFVPTETCTTHCEDVAMETDCAARLYTTCEGECTATAEVACVETCTTDCTPVCTTHEADPTPPNAMGLCMSDCQQDCTDDCAGAANKGECRSSCAHTCGELCEKRCDGDDSTTCAPRCDVACEGSCTAQASSACQVTCQSKQFTTCKTEQVQVCEKDCKETGGALFCDGQFLAVTDLQACADELFAELAIDVEINLDVDVECKDTSCKADADADGRAGCLSTVDAGGSGLGGALMILGVLGLQSARRRRRV